MRYFATHAGKGVLFIGAAAFLLAWPPALPWIAAVALLQLGVKHLTLAFKESDSDLSVHARVAADSPALPPPTDSERGIASVRNNSVRTRS